MLTVLHLSVYRYSGIHPATYEEWGYSADFMIKLSSFIMLFTSKFRLVTHMISYFFFYIHQLLVHCHWLASVTGIRLIFSCIVSFVSSLK